MDDSSIGWNSEFPWQVDLGFLVLAFAVSALFWKLGFVRQPVPDGQNGRKPPTFFMEIFVICFCVAIILFFVDNLLPELSVLTFAFIKVGALSLFVAGMQLVAFDSGFQQGADHERKFAQKWEREAPQKEAAAKAPEATANDEDK
ncbi:hypothetical protein PbB2_02080 [Candidatus Phycosocius bacilliformis]|uniref:Uncharacterized protein n=1 Tax=Candidatus Phycosocius bacilliformis TaxID=1445552 RepID=A0A2P2EBG1_9PROT|nr:hypothetical protein [Candidatus Phycosocius bacilliformis]GBF58398.1 hypothetical protein PbB2_02080 [Candidatus Phycosocius bacilliformis]